MFALPARRSSPDTLREQSQKLPSHGELIGILDHLPYMVLILTTELQIIHANRSLLDTLGLNTIAQVLSRRPGEVLECIHSRTHVAGCGSAEGCRHCQARQVITDCFQGNCRTAREVRISARVGSRLTAYDLKVTATPLVLGEQSLAMVCFEDIGAQKRREHLESIFLHDLLNSVGSLQMLNELMLVDPGRINPGELERQLRLLTDEIRAQQLLIEAERGQLAYNILCVPVRGLFEDTLAAIKAWGASRGLALECTLPESPVYLATDPLIARRVLLNAVKNAAEAAAAGDTVKIGVREESDTVTVTVWNPQWLEDATRHQIFQRSFSTKGKGRGLGTYSMRLLMENYLNGTVDFTSDPAGGTTFFLSFPSMRSYLARMG